MKKIFTIILAAAVAALSFGGCDFEEMDDLRDKVDDMDGRLTALEEKVDKLNRDLDALGVIVRALENGYTITDYIETAEGCTITFSDGHTVTIKNGADGTDAPFIGVQQDADGVYYWTLTTGGQATWLLDGNGNKMRVTGATPEIGIDGDGYWTLDGVRIKDSSGNDVKAAGSDGDSFFKSVTDNGDSVTIVLADGTEIVLPKSAPFSFVIEGASGILAFSYGDTRTLNVTAVGVAGHAISKPDGWKASYTDDKLSITAPDSGNTFADSEGEVAVLAVSATGAGIIAKVSVKIEALTLHTITFDEPYFAPFVAATYAPGVYGTWESPFDESYIWTDATTQLATGFAMYPWIVSSYNSNSLDTGSYAWYTHDLYVYNPVNADSMTGGGHNGSDNFLIGFGYQDLVYDYGDWRPVFNFADGRPRMIKSVRVNSTNYFLGTVAEGNGLSPALAPGEDVTLVATGFDAAGNKISETTMPYATYEKVTSEWTEWDLTALGEVVSIKINMIGGPDNGYGFSLPAYYAIDDITVVLP